MNPYIAYLFTFLLAIAVYLLGWSDLYPSLSGSLIVFLGATFLAAGWLALRWNSKKIVVREVSTGWSPEWVTVFIYALWSLDFWYEGGIPLIKILTGAPYNYRLFGFPSVHVFTVTFASFYTVFLFHCWRSGQRSALIWCLVNLMAAILIYSRAMLMFNVSSCLMIYLATSTVISFRKALLATFGAIALMYVFGVLGTLRSSREAHKPYDNNLFLSIGKPTPGFVESPIPPEFFWSYIYISSPLANLQTNVNNNHDHSMSPSSWARLINNEVLMDFISKRINSITSSTRAGEHTIPGPFNVSTVYSRSYSYTGWWGMLLLAFVIGVVPWIYRRMIHDENSFAITGMAILCTIYAFMFYDNTIRFTGLALQLLYPVLLQGRVGRLIRFGINHR